MNHEKCIRSKRKKMPLNSQQSLYVSEHIMICQNQSCSLYVCVWLFVWVNCYPTLFPLRNNSSRVTTATAGIHYSMNAVTTHPHIKHPRWASFLCAQMENPTLLAPRCFGSGTLRHRPENSPNTKVRQMLCDGKWEQHTHDGHIICQSFLFSFSSDSLSFICWHKWIWHIFIQSTCVLFKLLGAGDADQMMRFAFLDISVYFSARNVAPENSAASKPMAAKHSKIHSWPNATERTKHTRPVTFLLSEENISLVGF